MSYTGVSYKYTLLSVMANTRQLWHIYAMLVIDIVVANLLGPLLNEYVGDLPAKAVWLTGGTALMLGTQLATAPTIGEYTDKNGRKKALIFTTIGSLLTTLLLLPVQAWGYITNRVTKGVTNGMYSVLRSAITDLSDPKDTIKTASLHSFVVGFGSVIGPMVGGLLLVAMPESRKNPVPLVIMALILAGINVGLAFLFKETNEKDEGVDIDKLKEKAINSLKIKALWEQLNESDKQLPGLKPLFILNLIATFGVGYYAFFVAFLTQSKLKLEPLQTSYFFMFFGVLSCIANVIFFRHIADRIDKRKVLIVCPLIGAILMILYAFSESSPTLLYIVAGVDAFTVTLIAGLTGGLLSQLAAQGEGQGEAFGSFQALGGLASFVTAVINTALSGISLKAPFIWCAVCMIAMVIWTLRLPEEAKQALKSESQKA